MEVLLARHGTAAQARGFILFDVLHRFEEDEALDSACGCVCTWASLLVTARRAPYGILRVAARASLSAARVTVRCARYYARRAAARCARRTAARRTMHGKGGVHTVDRRTRKRHHSLHDLVLWRNNWSPRRILRRRVQVEQVFLDVHCLDLAKLQTQQGRFFF